MAQSGDFLARIKLALEGKQAVVSGLAETQRAAQGLAKTKITTIFDKEGLATGKQIEETFTGVGKAAGKSFQQMGDFEKALSRVLIVAPVWMVARAAIQAVTQTISEGFQVWVSFDQQLIKSKAVIHDYAGTTDQAMGQLEGTIRDFSKESGIALDQLASSFYRFGTVGIAFSDALSGAIASAKLAKATLGDVDTISRSLAMTYRLLGDTIDKSLSPMQKQESLAGKIFHLWKTNAFEANEFASSLNNFASQANMANFTTDQAMGQLEGTIRDFSKQSGIALDQLASSFYRFGTVGIAFSDALSGAIASAKLAKATLGDVDTISRALAMTYRLLGDTIDESLTPMQTQESLAGKILHLWRTNAFEANEFAGSLQNFASTANIANFTADQTVALLSALGTAGVQGARGGTLLKTAIQKLVDNLDDLAPKLGIAVNPELENTFDVFMRVLETINKLSQTKGIPAEALASIKDIFGGVRGGQVVSALNALLPELKKNLEDLGRDPQEFIKGLDNRFKEVTDTVSGQLEIFKRMKELVGESFVKGVVGAQDFKESLKEINTTMEGMALLSAEIGNFINFWSNPIKSVKKDFKVSNEEAELFGKRVEDAQAGLLSFSDTVETITLLSKKWGEDTYTKDIIKRIQNTATEILKNAQFQKEANKAIEDYNTNVIQAGKGVDKQTNVHLN